MFIRLYMNLNVSTDKYKDNNMNYLTNYYKNLSEQLQEKVNHLQNLLEEYPKNKVKGMKLSIIDRVSGTAYDQTGEGAKFIAQGEDGKHYTFNSAAKWAWDNEDPGEAPQTFEVDTANPDHEIRDVMPVDWNNKHDARELHRYHPDFRG